MTTHHEIHGACVADLLAEIDAITTQAMEDGRTYRIGMSSRPEGVCAVITVYPKKEQEE